MKPLPAAPLTEEDRQSNFAFVSRCRLSLFAAKLLLDSATADRRDAELMFWLTRFGVQHYATFVTLYGERPPFWMAIAHMMTRMDPEWPTGHYGIDLT